VPHSLLDVSLLIGRKKEPKLSNDHGDNMKTNDVEAFEAVVQLFDRPGGWYYVVVPENQCQPYDDLQERGLIAVIASARSGDMRINWQTSLLPMGDGSHFLALPTKVRNRLKIGIGDRIGIEFSIRQR
jgi:hypothetical protein